MNALAFPLELTWTDIGAVTDIPPRGARRLPTAGGTVAVFRTGDGHVYALRDVCPHKRGPLSQGIVHGHAVTCPLHGWSISLATGEAMGADAGKGCTPTLPVRLVDGRILIGRR